MKAALFALLLTPLAGTPALAAAGDSGLYTLYASGNYDQAMHDGAATHSATGYAIAARAALADAMLRDAPCMECLKRAESYARQAVTADPKLADGQVWLAAALGYEARIDGLVIARLHDSPGQSRAALDAALRDDPENPYAIAALGGWHIEIVHGGGAAMARVLYSATEAEALQLFDRAARVAPGNVAVHYQIGLSLAGFEAQKYHSRIESELTAAMQNVPATLYEKTMQTRAGDLLALLRRGDRDALTARVRKYQGYPE
jgi:hypothetical protein